MPIDLGHLRGHGQEIADAGSSPALGRVPRFHDQVIGLERFDNAPQFEYRYGVAVFFIDMTKAPIN